MPVKIAIIGAGSATFSLSLVRDLCLTPSLSDSLIHMMDVDEPRLEGVHRLAERYSQELGNRLDIRKTTDRVECITDADFVIHTALGPGLDRLVEGWQVAFRHGYRFGGSLHIVHDEAFWINYHQLVLMESIAQDVAKHCPKAWYVLVANPVLAGMTYLARKYPEINTVALCHGYSGVFRLARELGLDPAAISYDIPGVNHFVWLTRFEHKGRDAYPILDRWVDQQSGQHFASCPASSHMGPKAIDLYKRFGVFPIGDTGNPGGGSWGYWYHADTAAEQRWNEDPWNWYRNMIINGNARVDRINRVATDPSVKVTEEFGADKSHEVMVPLVECLSGYGEAELIVNVANCGDYVAGVPEGFDVEVPATVNSSGIHPRRPKPLPRELQHFLQRDRVAPVELELAAYEKGRRDYLVELALMDPWTRTAEQAESLVEEIINIPYNEPMKRHYK